MPHLHVVQPNTRFLCVLPLKWQTLDGGAVDDSSGMWTFKRGVQTCYERAVCFSDVRQPILCLREESGANFLYNKHSFQLLFLCCNFAHELCENLSSLVFCLYVWTCWGNPPCRITESSCFGPQRLSCIKNQYWHWFAACLTFCARLFPQPHLLLLYVYNSRSSSV